MMNRNKDSWGRVKRGVILHFLLTKEKKYSDKVVYLFMKEKSNQ